MMQDIVLIGNDAREFYRKIFHPTNEEIEENRRAMEEIDKIKINEIENGFEAEVPDLDLSWLERM